MKPSNILLTNDGHAKISDFGIAHLPRDEQDVALTLSGSNLGTINFMSPEQARGDNRITPAADIYSVGATLFAAVVGRYYLPFRAMRSDYDYETLAYNFKLVKERDPEKPRKYNSFLLPQLENIIVKCLEKDIKRRYPSAEEVSFALNQVRVKLEEERERTFEEAENFYNQAKWSQALKLYDKLLAVDDSEEEATVRTTLEHREVARKWLSDEPVKDIAEVAALAAEESSQPVASAVSDKEKAIEARPPAFFGEEVLRQQSTNVWQQQGLLDFNSAVEQKLITPPENSLPPSPPLPPPEPAYVYADDDADDNDSIIGRKYKVRRKLPVWIFALIFLLVLLLAGGVAWLFISQGTQTTLPPTVPAVVATPTTAIANPTTVPVVVATTAPVAATTAPVPTVTPTALPGPTPTATVVPPTATVGFAPPFISRITVANSQSNAEAGRENKNYAYAENVFIYIYAVYAEAKRGEKLELEIYGFGSDTFITSVSSEPLETQGIARFRFLISDLQTPGVFEYRIKYQGQEIYRSSGVAFTVTLPTATPVRPVFTATPRPTNTPAPVPTTPPVTTAAPTTTAPPQPTNTPTINAVTIVPTTTQASTTLAPPTTTPAN
jgi:Protein kinase domain